MSYGYGGYGYNDCGCGYAAPVAAPVASCGGFGNSFVLIVVLFILLIIVGAAWL
ncbi:YjcZ family sporulation protein [Cytobacillus oceanisediminis]|uniref:YjcZ family sporulation protein n=1 Tax=Niallia alba TaxID=2729105 RepID=A0A7Y0K9S7_9BACI|nr:MULTISPECIES: YjcZ family sporulation protein [Bacillaceae]MBQ6446159.1 YjcZ family sporulation protein [Bacillus sp. (in: firmicutes)]MBZ9535087.1 YjcZ family sporulation protein [Cytobacillus oceanisediminis]MED3791550.1 YjcZ family sporulation protein [Niallia alba]NMO77790.1 YjcZ family sporulation protein [Niallia alba]UTI40953.1 YjcZ family sporulation protein [Niallia sp. RD1]